MERIIVEIEVECSWRTPGARWCHGEEYFYVVASVDCPAEYENEDPDTLLEWAADEVNDCHFL